MFDRLPPVLSNMVSQLLTDQDNHRLASTCRAALPAIRDPLGPRQACFRLNERSGNMYRRYRDIHVFVGHDVKDKTHMGFRRAMIALDWLDKIPPRDVRRIRFTCVQYIPPVPFASRLEWNDSAHIEMALRLERLPVFENVRHLDVADWPGFRALWHFPNTQHLRIEIVEDAPVSYPDLLQLETLHVTNEFVWDELNRDEFDRDESYILETFPCWPSVHTIKTERRIPVGYPALRHVDVLDMQCVPVELAAQLETILHRAEVLASPDPDHVWYDIDNSGRDRVDLLRCTALRELTLFGHGVPHSLTVRCAAQVVIQHPFDPEDVHRTAE